MFTGYSDDQLTTKLAIRDAIASNSFNKDTLPLNIIDGKEHIAWNSGGFARQWIQIELEESSTISKMRLLVHQQPDGEVLHNFWGGESPDHASMSFLGKLEGTLKSGEWVTFTPEVKNIPVRYILVETMKSPSWIAWGEIEVYGASNKVKANKVKANKVKAKKQSLVQKDATQEKQNTTNPLLILLGVIGLAFFINRNK